MNRAMFSKLRDGRVGISGTWIKGVALAAAATLAVATPASAANIVVNGGFEQGLTGWVPDNIYGNSFGSSTFASRSGTMSAATGCFQAFCTSTQGQGAFIKQDLATTIGSIYTLTFYVGENAGPTSGLSVFWGSLKVLDMTNPANNSLANTTTNGRYEGTFKKITVANLIGLTPTTALEIHGYQFNGTIFFDDVSVDSDATAAVPEPASWAMLIVGFGVVGGTLRRRPVSARVRFT